MLHSWGLTMPPRLVHWELQGSCFYSLGSSKHMQRQTGTAHSMHEDTPVHGGQGSGRSSGVMAGGREGGRSQQGH